MRHAFGERFLHLVFARVPEGGIGLRGDEKIHRHVSAAAQRGLKLFERQEDFAVVIAGVLLRLNVDRSHQAAVLACREVRSGAHMRVVETEA